MALANEIASGLMLGALAFVGMLVAVTAMQTLALVANGSRLRDALPRAAGRTWAVAGGVFAAVALVLQNGFGAIDVLTNGIATAPLAASNILTMVLGLLGISGYISDTAFIVGAASFALFTVIMREVKG